MGIQKYIVASVVGIGICLLSASVCQADVLYQSATSSSSTNSGVAIGGGNAAAGIQSQYVGVRFEVLDPVIVDAVGGNFSMDAIQQSPAGLFAELVSLGSATDFPSATDGASTDTDAIAFTTFTVSNSVASDITLPILPRELMPGWYALTFGPQSSSSSLRATASSSNMDVDTPSFITRHAGTSWYNDSPGLNERFYIIAAPLPGVAGSAVVFLAVMGTARIARQRFTGATPSN
ncbi:MAG TPA: hypothetical protein VFC78_02865 [Tepidisphaeraceae bacterium]|nr:hypothetical protein [Tepidisphaeraceae bacterium]